LEQAVVATDLTKYYGSLLAVDHVDFEVEKGEIFGFLGPNGAGKSTTVRMLTGISKPSEGTAEVMGFDIQRQAVKAKELMGIVPDISNVYTELSAWDNLVFTGRLYNIPTTERENRAEELLEMFGLPNCRRETVEVFSKGMKRRLCIAMALMNRSSILFLDEPTSGLDVQSVLMIRELIKKMNQDGLTVFLTTHNMDEANRMCGRVAIIDRGKVVAIDTPENLRQTIEMLHSVDVSFQEKEANLAPDLGKFSMVTEVAKYGDRYRLYTKDPSTVLSDVWNFASARGLKITTINTLGPSLEDVFVKLTGIRLHVRGDTEQEESDRKCSR